MPKSNTDSTDSSSSDATNDQTAGRQSDDTGDGLDQGSSGDQGGQDTAGQDRRDSFDADYVAKLRAENAKYRTQARDNAAAAKRLAEIEEADKTETQKLAERAERAERERDQAVADALKASVAAETGIPEEFLTGSTREELKESADRLNKHFGDKQKRDSRTDFGAGDRGKSGPAQVTEADLERMTPEQIRKAQDEGRLADLLGPPAA